MPNIVVPNGEFLLPVCISGEAMHDLVSALDLYRKIGKKSENYPALEAVLNAIQLIETPENAPCLPVVGGTPSIGGCVNYATNSSFITYEPQNPFTEPDLVPNGYLSTPFDEWARFESFLPDFIDNWVTQGSEYVTGYRTGDVLVNIASIPIFANWFNDFGGGLPRIQIDVVGSGLVQLSLLNIPVGGRAVIAVDTEANIPDILNGVIAGNVRIVELQRDLSSFPFETNADIIEEVEFTGDAETPHRIYITFVPTIDDSAIPLQFGGGLRFVRLCGDDIRPATAEETGGSGGDGTGNDYQFEEYIIVSEQDLYNALVRWTNERARRWLQGQVGNIVSGIELGTEPDPITGEINPTLLEQFNETPIINAGAQEQRNGGHYRQAQGIANLVAEAVARRDAGEPTTVAELLFNVLISPVDDVSFSQAVADFWASQVSPVIDILALTESLFCNGQRTGMALYLGINHSANEIELISKFTLQIPDSKWREWFQEGTQSPRDDYLTYDCYRFPPFSIVLDSADPADNREVPISGAPTGPRRYRVTFEGELVDVIDNASFDGIYSYDLTTNEIGYGGLIFVPQANYPYQKPPVGSRVLIVETSGTLTGTDEDFSLPHAVFGKVFGTASGQIEGSLKITFEDLGKV